jgi:hypothetical protein
MPVDIQALMIRPTAEANRSAGFFMLFTPEERLFECNYNRSDAAMIRQRCLLWGQELAVRGHVLVRVGKHETRTSEIGLLRQSSADLSPCPAPYFCSTSRSFSAHTLFGYISFNNHAASLRISSSCSQALHPYL